LVFIQFYQFYVRERYVVPHSSKLCVNRNATICTLWVVVVIVVVVGVDVAVNNIKVSNVAMELQKCLPFALLLS
jgi:hypothetical protein